MIGRKPEGYKDLLAYQKAAALQEENLKLTILFPKKFSWLKEQMDKSGRSGTKNIIEGWKRNSTSEYFTFLGFSIAAIEELKDDCADIAKGLYPELPITPITPFLNSQLEKLKFYPLDVSLPPTVQLYLRCKEALMLFHKLQQSLDQKMTADKTLSVSEMSRRHLKKTEKAEREEEGYLAEQVKKAGMVRLKDGRIVKREEWD